MWHMLLCIDHQPRPTCHSLLPLLLVVLLLLPRLLPLLVVLV
jgi:hypothetical protein